MLKFLFAASALTTLISGPVFAQDAMKCDEASMTKMENSMSSMSAADKEMAMKEMKMAKTSMMDKKMDDCKMHMDNAAKSMKKM